jgi:1-acyl-sn-glycerol-3-phosphate acyltransferase
MRKCHVISVGRDDVDTAAFKTVLKRLQRGRIVGVFPEGGLRAGATSVLEGARMKEGISLLAAKSGCCVRPAVIVGSDQLYVGRNWLRRPRVVIAVGEPIPPPFGKQGRKGWTDQLANEMRKLYGEVKRSHQLEEVVLPKTPQERWKAGR